MIIEAVIEDPKGATHRHHLDLEAGEWRAVPHPHAVSPWPVNYGFIPGTYNPMDGDALDVMVLAQRPLPTGTRLEVRPVGVLRRPDGDHKVLAVAANDPQYRAVQELRSVPVDDIAAIERWFLEWSPLGSWADAPDAVALIARMRATEGATDH